jgi:ABC-type dipeptide/oligopeptide/nickel transport system permease subunit
LKFDKVIGKDIGVIAACLGVPQVEIDRLKMENPNSMSTAMQIILLAWKRRLGHAATLEELEEAFMEANRVTGASIDWQLFRQAKDTILKKKEREENQTNSERRGQRRFKCCII